MNLRTLRTASLVALLLPGLAAATEYRKVQGWVEDSSKPNLKMPKEFDLDNRGSNSFTTTANVGTVPSADVSAVEYGTPYLHTTVFTVSGDVTITDATTAGAHGAVQLYDFPAGLVYLFGVSSDLSITAGAGGIADNASVVCAVGTATVETDNGTLAGTDEATLGPSTAATLSSGAGACDVDGTTALIAIHNGSATAIDAFLNFAIPDAGVTDGQNDTLTVSGTVTITWAFLGDN